MVRLLGIDLDNTLANYDRILARIAADMNLSADVQGKQAIRDAVRCSSGGDVAWQRIQARIYGPLMGEAELADGLVEFLDSCKQGGVRVFVVSHRTEFAPYDVTGTSLHSAARVWMNSKGLFGRFGINPDDVYLERERNSKVERISSLGVDAFIDDLEEVFREPGFPVAVERLLYKPNGESVDGPFKVFKSFVELRHELFGA